MSHANLFSGWSRGPGYTSPQHRLILGLRVAILRPACSSTGTETEKGQELCIPPCAHFVLTSSVPYAHFHVFIPAYSRPVYSTLQCVCPFPPTPCDHSVTLCPSLAHCYSLMLVLCPLSLMAHFKHVPKSCAFFFVSPPRTKDVLVYTPMGLKGIYHQS